VLEDGRPVVIKCHQPDVAAAALTAMARVRRHLERARIPLPTFIGGPFPIGRGLATIEALLACGVRRDPHEREVARRIAELLAELVAHSRPFSDDPALPWSLLGAPRDGARWPRPHSRLFDFAATQENAERIDEVADAAVALRAETVGAWVVGHADLRAEHVRFVAADGVAGLELAAIYDWDSLSRVREPFLVGQVAHAFCADWALEDHRQAPTLAEARQFIDDYQRARGTRFSREERAAIGAAFAYSVAYTARCEHALDPHGVPALGGFRSLLHAEGRRLLHL
jgi:hypothetical protein